MQNHFECIYIESVLLNNCKTDVNFTSACTPFQVSSGMTSFNRKLGKTFLALDSIAVAKLVL